MQPLSKVLETIQRNYNVRLYPNNLTRQILPGPDGEMESIMTRLAHKGLALLDMRGPHGLWLMEDTGAAMDELRLMATGVRPGRPPGKRVTLSENETVAFLSELPPDPKERVGAIRSALAAATGWDAETVDRVELIGLRVPPVEGR